MAALPLSDSASPGFSMGVIAPPRITPHRSLDVLEKDLGEVFGALDAGVRQSVTVHNASEVTDRFRVRVVRCDVLEILDDRIDHRGCALALDPPIGENRGEGTHLQLEKEV